MTYMYYSYMGVRPYIMYSYLITLGFFLQNLRKTSVQPYIIYIYNRQFM